MSFLIVFKKELEKDVAGDTSGNFAKLLLALVQVRFVNAHRTYDSYHLSLYSRNWPESRLISVQTKRAEPSSVVDYEKIDEDARVSCLFSIVCGKWS